MLQRAEDARQAFADAGVAGNTARAFKADWAGFRAWVQRAHRVDMNALPKPMPREVALVLLTLYLSTLGVPDPDNPDPSKRRDEPLKMSTIRRAYTGILYELRKRDPATWPEGDRPHEVRAHLRAMAKTLTLIETRKKPILRDLVLHIVEHMPGTGDIRIRNLALFLFGWVTASRRAEVIGYDLGDIRWDGEHATVMMRKSKTDQEGKGKVKVLEPAVRDPKCCPVAALRAWIAVRGDWPGPLFVPFEISGRMRRRRMNPRIVSRIVKAALEGALTPEEIKQFSGHSLRAGFATQAQKDGKSMEAIARQTGHESYDQLQKYLRSLDPYKDNAAEGLL